MILLLCLLGLVFKDVLKESAPYMDGLRARGWLVSIGSINAGLKPENNLPPPFSGSVYTTLKFFIGRTVHSVPEIFCYLFMNSKNFVFTA